MNRSSGRRGGSAPRRLFAYLRRQPVRLAAVLACVVCGTLALAAGPFVIGRIIDGRAAGPELAAQCLFLLMVYVFAALCGLGQARGTTDIAQRAVGRLREDVFAHLLRLPAAFMGRSRGELMSRVTHDMELLATSLQQGLPQLLSSLLLLLATLAFMLHLSPRLAAVTLTCLALTATLTRFAVARSRRCVGEQQRLLGEINGAIEEHVEGLQTIHLHGARAATLAAFDTRNAALRAAAVRAQVVAGCVGPLMNTCSNFGFAVLVAGGAWMVWHELASLGLVAAFLSYARQLERPANEFANQFNLVQAALVGAERAFEILDTAPENTGPRRLTRAQVRGEVEFERVGFAYTEGRPVLCDISLHACPGERIALVGQTGAGKSTLFNLLLQFIEAGSGVIRIDGIDARTLDRRALRRCIGVVAQEPYLFGGTVLDNLRYGNPDAGADEVRRVAALVGLDAAIAQWPQGYATVLRAGGANLSQGERQLLSIARALLADPAILLLDEATGNLDARAEARIQQALALLLRGRTCFAIAHRLDTVRGADQILVLDRGRIVERGRHADLLAAGGEYARLWRASVQDRKVLPTSALETGP